MYGLTRTSIMLLVLLSTMALQPCLAQSWGQLHQAATASMKLGDAGAAEKHWRTALESCGEADSSDPRYVLSVRGLARCLQEQGKLAEAEGLYAKLLPAPNKISASNSDLLAAAMEYALVLHKQGKSEKAAEIDKQIAPALEQARKAETPAPTVFSFGGPDNQSMALEKNRLKWEKEEGTCTHKPPVAPIRLPEAKATASEADEKLPGEQRDQKIAHTDKWQILGRRGEELLQQERYADAEKILRQAYAETRIYHRHDQAHQDLMLDLATAFAGQGKVAETETMFRLAFLWAKNNTGDISDENVRVWERYSAALRKLGRQTEATVAESHYENTLFKLNNARSNGQIRSLFGPITHIGPTKSLFDRPASRRPPPNNGNLFQHPQRMERYQPGSRYPEYRDYSDFDDD
ncbi:MAG: hypothetical protein K2W95_18975 [Candidatus Obscuribacterales bacterium]|nr:hypothetical protein [Candidatus Obscuribacterales bacterium]